MFEDDEHARLWQLMQDCTRAAKRRADQLGTGADATLLAELEPVRRLHREIAGVDIEVPARFLHHRLSSFGPPCHRCGRPLRTPRARHCAACGEPAFPT